MQRPPEPLPTIESSVFVTDSLVGVEIEVEGMSHVNLSSWNTVAEHSVRGFELVLRQPMRKFELSAALEELNDVTWSSRAFSERTSVHVHIDIRDMTFDQLMNFITLSAMFEKVLYNYVDSSRTANHFCWAMSDCEQMVQSLRELNTAALRRRESDIYNMLRHTFSLGSYKYAGINLASISRYGSLEFRMHHGTADTKELIRWINILLKIKEYAMGEERTPSNILSTKQNAGIDSIFLDVLGHYSGILDYDRAQHDILCGIRLAQDFVNVITNPSNQADFEERDLSQLRDILRTMQNHLGSQGRRILGLQEPVEDDDEDEEEWHL